MAEEDLIFGKNRHFFGGIEPDNMKTFTVKYSSENELNRAKILAVLPGNTVIDNQTLCTVAGAIIRRKKDSMPINEFDGVLVRDLKESATFFDEDVEEDQTYYYAAYPYTTQGVYNRNPINTGVVTILKGYPPDKLTSFVATPEVVSGTPRIKLTVGIPANSIVDGVQANTVKGVIIRRSTSAYPVDENDGDFLVDLSASGNNPATFYDTNVELNAQYYYSGFPYTTQNVYNRDQSNRTSAMAVGAIPGSMKVFTVKAAAILEDPVMVVKYQLPDTTAEISSVEVQIRRKITGYPTNNNDGDLITTVYTIPGDNSIRTYIDKDVVDGTKYYYRAFPTSPDGVYNTETTPNQSTATAKSTWAFGYVEKGYTITTSPSGRISYDSSDFDDISTYPGHPTGLTGNRVDNASFVPAKMNFNTGKFEPGDWDLEPGTFFMPRPCVLGYDGRVRYYLNPNDYTQKEDGTPIDLINGDNVMMEWPRVYVYHGGVNTKIGTIFSNKQINSSYELHNIFMDLDNNAMKYAYTAVYPGIKSVVGSKNVWKSIPGVHPTMLSGNSTNVSGIATDATNVITPTGSVQSDLNWNLHIIGDDTYIGHLLILMGKSLDTQGVFGCGSIGVSTQETVNSYITTGKHDKKGLFWGSKYNSADKYPGLKVFGMEDFWGGLGKLTATVALLRIENGTKDFGYDYGDIYSEGLKDAPWHWGPQFSGKDGYLPSLTFEHPKVVNSYGNQVFNYLQGYLSLYTPFVTDNDGNVTGGEMMTNQIQNQYIGNDFIRALGLGSMRSLPCASLNKSPHHQEGDDAEFSLLGGSSTTNYCDYAAVDDYPTVSGTKRVIYPHLGSDKSLTGETSLKRAGIFYIHYSDNIVGTNVRLSYKSMGL